MDRVKLSEIANIKMGQSPEGSTCNETGAGIPLLNGPTEFANFHPAPKQYTTDPKRLSEAGDVLFCVRGSTTGRMNWSDQSYAIGRGLAAISHKEGKKLNYYLKYLIEYNLTSLLKATSGSTFPNLTNDILASFELLVTDLPSQQKIAAVLFALDAKIELNQRINAELEQMAKTLYNYWFVQFEFPNHQSKPYKSAGGKMIWNEELKREIPDGWDVGDLANYIRINRGISYKSSNLSDNGIPMVNLNSFYLNGSYKPEGIKYLKSSLKSDKRVKAGDLLVAATDVTRNAYIIGKSFILPDIFTDQVTASTDALHIEVSERLDKYYLNMLFNSNDYHRYIKGFATGTLVLHLNTKGIEWYKTTIPPKELLNQFSQLKQTVEQKKGLIIKENQTLTELRDWLLPMLMNGQVVVNGL